ncbi:MAG: carboxylesterase/lipase family protein [Kofleriaceae bacterium]
MIETTRGAVRGAVHGEVASWKGIPYAAPPVGALRFRPPVPPARWTGERDATRFGPVAAQSRDPRIAIMSGVTDKVESGEDALYLNVFAPAEARDKQPVAVWIHGGAFIMGSGSTPLYHGETFARQGIVVVTLNYRLGLPGFLYLGDLAPDRAEGNYALLDQIAALGWVRDNIAAFGGDPDNVTVMGESAGAIAIANLLAMPAARGLFHRAILESGGLTLSPPTRADATKVARQALAQLGVTVDQLADVPLDRLLACQEQLASELGLGAFAPYIDGVTLPRPPIDVIREGGAAHIPLLAGSNRDEWTLFQVFLGDVTIDGYKAPLRDKLGPLLDRLVEVYRAAEPGRTEQRAWVDLVGELVFRIPVIRLAEAQAQRGAPVYLYRFDFRSPVFGGRLGAAHALELPFVWNRLDLPMATVLLGDSLASAQPLATAMHASWVQFIRGGDPNGAGLPAWPRYDAERRPTMMLDRTCAVVDDPAGEARALWPAVWPA